MKTIYEKGTFNTVPNKNHLKGKPAEMQTIYFWIVDHADKNGSCFPSRTTLAEESGCNIKTVDKYIKQLILDGFITKTQRKKVDSNKHASNIYQLLNMECIPFIPDLSTEIGTDPQPEIGAVTIPSINNTHITTITEVKNGLTLNVELRGKTPSQRLMTIYQDCFQYVYGFKYKPNFGRDLKILKDLLESYSELQIARLLTIYFNWKGMSGSDERDSKYLTENNYPLALFKSNVVKYETFIRNVLREDFESDQEMLTKTGMYIQSIKPSSYPQILLDSDNVK